MAKNISEIAVMQDIDIKKQTDGFFSYCGGKARILNYIAQLVYSIECNTFIDICAGAGTVSLNIKAKRKIMLDAALDLTVIYKALSCKETEDKLLKRMNSTYMCAELRDEAQEYWDGQKGKKLDDYDGDELVKGAFYSWILHKFSRVGSDTTNECNYDKKYRSYENFKKKLVCYYGKLIGAEVRNENLLVYLKYLSEHPEEIGDNTVIYIDPVYLSNPNCKSSGKSSAYKRADNKYTFGWEEHKQMLQYVEKLPRDKCKVIISGYNSVDKYDPLLSNFGTWRKVFVKTISAQCTNGAKYADTPRPVADEFFYINFDSEVLIDLGENTYYAVPERVKTATPSMSENKSTTKNRGFADNPTVSSVLEHSEIATPPAAVNKYNSAIYITPIPVFPLEAQIRP